MAIDEPGHDCHAVQIDRLETCGMWSNLLLVTDRHEFAHHVQQAPTPVVGARRA